MDPYVHMKHPFRSYLGIDWSGAAEYSAPKDEPDDWPIQMAVVRADSALARFQEPPDGAAHWTRTSLVDTLARQLALPPKDPRPALIGFGFAFSLPYADKGAFLPELPEPPSTWAELAGLLGRYVTPDTDFKPHAVLHDSPLGDYFADEERKKQGSRYEQRYRVAEDYEKLYGDEPASVFLLGNRQQVGMGSIAGIACLLELKKRLGDAIHIWPLEGTKWADNVRAVVVEAYPRLMYRLCMLSPDAYKQPPVVFYQMKELGLTYEASPATPGPMPMGKNHVDAMMTAAALHRHARNPMAWGGLYRAGEDVFRREGWIWAAGTHLPARLEAWFQKELDAKVAEFKAALQGAAPGPQADWRFWYLRGVLATVASKRETILVEEAAALCGLYRDDLFSHLKALQNNLLGDEPDLSAVVVNNSGHPSNHWNTEFKWNKSVQARWEATRDAVYDYWSRRRGILLDPSKIPFGVPRRARDEE